jgi:hypothetical protein
MDQGIGDKRYADGEHLLEFGRGLKRSILFVADS